MIANRTKKGIKYVREKWTEYFWVHVSKTLIQRKEMGMRVPRFYLPVKWIPVSNIVECWIFPIAPFAILYYLISGAVIKIWRDLIELIDLMRE